jgi:hypothetical protein
MRLDYLKSQNSVSDSRRLSSLSAVSVNYPRALASFELLLLALFLMT